MIKIHNIWLIPAVVFLMVLIPCFLFSENIEIKNEFIEVIGNIETGRFIIKTTGGDPDLKSDNNALLLYDDVPPSTYTTVKIDNKNSIFGGNTGRFLQKLIKKNDNMVCHWQIKNISVIQNLKFVKGLITGRDDTVEISYKIWNKDTKSHDIALRIALDTCLGKDDGAPFRLPGIDSIQEEKELTYEQIPQYWYSFDDLSKPTIRAQGTLKIPNFPDPDKVIFASYARFYDELWDFPIKPGRSFSRGFLQPVDSAVGIYWNALKIEPGDSLIIKTYYGLYGASLESSKTINVSLSSPAEVVDEPFFINVDMQNISSAMLEKVKATIILPPGLKLTDGQNELKIGFLDLNQMSRVSWNVIADQTVINEVTNQVLVEGIIKGKKVFVLAKRKMVIIKKEIKEAKIEEMKELLLLDFKKQDETMDVKKTPEGINVELGDICFKYNSDELIGEAKNQINKIGAVLQKQKNYRIVINGHTDNIGNAEYNLKLSENRAKAVFLYLVEKDYITEYQTAFKGLGDKNPIADNSTPEGRQRNRRVEVIIVPEY